MVQEVIDAIRDLCEFEVGNVKERQYGDLWRHLEVETLQRVLEMKAIRLRYIDIESRKFLDELADIVGYCATLYLKWKEVNGCEVLADSTY